MVTRMLMVGLCFITLNGFAAEVSDKTDKVTGTKKYIAIIKESLTMKPDIEKVKTILKTIDSDTVDLDTWDQNYLELFAWTITTAQHYGAHPHLGTVSLHDTIFRNLLAANYASLALPEINRNLHLPPVIPVRPWGQFQRPATPEASSVSFSPILPPWDPQ